MWGWSLVYMLANVRRSMFFNLKSFFSKISLNASNTINNNTFKRLINFILKKDKSISKINLLILNESNKKDKNNFVYNYLLKNYIGKFNGKYFNMILTNEKVIKNFFCV